MTRQRGMTFIGLIFFLVLFAGSALIAFKVVPFYIDYFTMRSMLNNIASEQTNATDSELRLSFARRANTNYLIGYSTSDLDIERDRGYLTLTVPLERKSPLFGGVSLLMELEAKAVAPLK